MSRPAAEDHGALALTPDRFREVVRRNALEAVDPAEVPAEVSAEARRAALARVLEAVAASLARGDAAAVLRALPRTLAAEMADFGWRWNGFYVLRADGRLHLGPAHGPPVCATLERAGGGGPLSSGMCFDGLLLNQTLVARPAKSWPGYVSCDAESGLNTVAGIVAPLRDPQGRPIAVWDLDATAPVTNADVRFCDVLFATLSRALALDERAFFAE